jgi:HK97 family phage prohead protease
MTTDVTTDAQLLLLEPDQERAATPEDGRTLLVRLLSWGEIADTPQGRETFARGAFDGIDPASVLLESQGHGGAIVGRGLELQDDGTAPILAARVSETTAGNDLLTLVRDGVLKRASVTFRPDATTQRKDGVLERTKVTLRKVAILPAGAYPSAEVVAMRQEEPEPERPAPLELLPGPQPQSNVLHRYASLGDALLGAYRDAETADELHRAFADDTLSANPGLNHPAWLTHELMRYTAARPLVAAFGGSIPLGDGGMTVSHPVIDEAETLESGYWKVGEKAGPTGNVRIIHLKSGSAVVEFITTGVSNSLQLLERSDPTYRQLQARLWLDEYAQVTEDEVWRKALQHIPGTAAANLKSAADVPPLIQAVALGDQTHAQAWGSRPGHALVIMGAGVWARLWAWAPEYFSLDSRRGMATFMGLPAYRAQSWPQKLVVTHERAFAVVEAGPYFISHPHVPRLSQQDAIYGYVAVANLDPRVGTHLEFSL